MRNKLCKGFLILWISLITCLFTQGMLISPKEGKINVEKVETNIIKSKNKCLEVDVKIPILNSENIKYISEDINNWTLGWIDDVKLVINEYQKMGYICNYPFKLYADYLVTENNNDILSFYLDYYQFTGGAHGITTRRSYNLNRKTGKKICLGDLFNKGYDYEKVINKEIRKQISEEKDKYFDSGSMFMGVENNTCFYITKDYLIIYYGVYEIAPYSSGLPEFKIPLSVFEDDFIYDNMKL